MTIEGKDLHQLPGYEGANFRKLAAEYNRLEARVTAIEKTVEPVAEPEPADAPVKPTPEELARMESRLSDLRYEKQECDDAALARDAEIDDLRRKLA